MFLFVFRAAQAFSEQITSAGKLSGFDGFVTIMRRDKRRFSTWLTRQAAGKMDDAALPRNAPVWCRNKA